MEFLAFANPLEPVIHALTTIIVFIDGYVHNLGWSLILLALLIRLAFWPLVTMQYKSMAEMQQIQPMVKALQAKLKSDPQKMNQEVMALYKEHNVNPFASCLPLLVQLPILFSLYWAIIAEKLNVRQGVVGLDRLPALAELTADLRDPRAGPEPRPARFDLARALHRLDVLQRQVRQPAVARSRAGPAAEDHGLHVAGLHRMVRAHVAVGADPVLVFDQHLHDGATGVPMRRFRAKLAAKAAAAENAPKDVTPRKGANAALAAADDGTAAATERREPEEPVAQGRLTTFF